MAHEWHMERAIPVPESGCWLWLGCTDQKGYGMVTESMICKRAHRASYERATGIHPGAMQVLHKCDTPACINPDHLFLGTNADNVRDKVAKGRQAAGDAIGSKMCGERQGQSKLNKWDVLFIRKSRKRGVELAAMFGVSQSVVSEIRSRKAWKHIQEKAA